MFKKCGIDASGSIAYALDDSIPNEIQTNGRGNKERVLTASYGYYSKLIECVCTFSSVRKSSVFSTRDIQWLSLSSLKKLP